MLAYSVNPLPNGKQIRFEVIEYYNILISTTNATTNTYSN